MVIVTVTTHYYDGKKSFPIEIKFYQHSSSLAKGKDDELFKKKPDIGIELIDRSLSRGLSPGIVLIDGGYGNNTTFLKRLEERELKYLGKIAKNRKVIVKLKSLDEREIRIDELAKSLPSEKFEPVILSLEKPKKVWVTTFTASTSRIFVKRTFEARYEC
jgi:SRSO17 transposase